MSASAPRRRSDRTLLVLLGVTAVALLARLALLGQRIAHWDEGRVGYDILRYQATGAWEYRPIVHGPFLPHVNKVLFWLLEPNDFTMRLAVAVVGGLLPLAAWLYRDRLRDVELVALAAFLAADPVLVYYSRFMRNDVLLAGFMFVAVGLFVRLVDTGRRRYLYAGAAMLALAFTTKENAIVYVVTILGALALLLDHRLFLARDGDPGWGTVARRYVGRVGRGLWRWRLALAVAAVEFVVIVVFFYAPRAGGEPGIGLWKAFGQPAMLPDVIEAATVGSADKLISSWVSGDHQDHAYLPFLADYLRVLAAASGPLALLAAFGFLSDRYRGERPRDVVAFAFYWGVVTALGYPIIVDIKAPWSVVHAVVPLAVPAAAGVAMVYDWGREARADGDDISVALAVVVVLLLAGQLVGTAATTSYLHPQREGNVLVQFAQPEGEMRPALEAVERAARDNEGLDVLWYGENFLVEDETAAHRLPLGDGEWYNRLPLPWYLERAGATVDSVPDESGLDERLAADSPPVIITCAGPAECPSDLGQVRERLDGYREYRYEGRQFQLDFVFFVDERYATADA